MPVDNVLNIVTAVCHLKTVNYLGQVVNDLDIGTVAVERISKDRTWVRTPGFRAGFRKRVTRRFDLPMNPFTYNLRKTSYPKGQMVVTSVGSNLPNGQVGENVSTYSGALAISGPLSYVGGLYPDLFPASMPEIDLEYLDASARSKLLLTSKDQKVNLVQAYAERGQTARLLSSTIKRVVSAIQSLKKGNLAGAASALGVKVSAVKQRRYAKRWHEDQQQAVANGWLELQYGWKPLYNDVVGAAELLAQKSIHEIRNRVVKSSSQTLRSDGTTDLHKVAPFHIHRTVRRKVTVKYVAYWSTSEVNHTLSQVGITNPLLIAWELLPWSFVYDWFLPIGNYISSLDATVGLSFEKGCKTVYEHILVTGRTKSGRVPYTGQGTGTLLAIDASEAFYSDEFVNINRTVLTAWPDPILPSFKNPVSLVHVANALALLKKTVRFR